MEADNDQIEHERLTIDDLQNGPLRYISIPNILLI